MRTLLLLGGLVGLLADSLAAPPDTSRVLRRRAVSLHSGFIIPHSPDLRPVSQTDPAGLEVSFSRLRLSCRAWETANCFARSGVSVSYVNYHNPAVLGEMLSVGGFFEPLLLYRGRGQLSARASGGLAYLTRVHDPAANPANLFFSSPLSVLLGLSLHAAYPLGRTVDLTLAAHYNHISNGGIRQPNKGMNFPTLAVGVAWQPERVTLPAYRPAQTPFRRWAGRGQVFGSMNVLPATDEFPETPRPLAGLTLTGLYRLTRFHALSVGAEAVADASIRERLRRDGADRRWAQVGLLAGYELWQGRYRFGVQVGYNALQPGQPYSDRFYQRYQLLRTLGGGWSLGLGLRATAHVAKGFDVRLGREF